MSIYRRDMFDTWKACAEAINEVIPDMSVSVADTGEVPDYPDWVTWIPFTLASISHQTEEWMKKSSNLFYTLHYPNADRVKKTQDRMRDWNMPAFGTEIGGCDQWNMLRAVNVSRSYWHYSAYCTTGHAFGNRMAPNETFGACILGWDGGNTTKDSDQFC